MWKVLTAVVVVLIAGSAWAGLSLVWPQQDYAAQGTCSAADIDKTYAALASLKDFRAAANERVYDEYHRFHRGEDGLLTSIQLKLNRFVDETFGRRQTAASLCNPPHVFFDGLKGNIPATAKAIAPHLTTDDDPWKLATCAAMLDPYAPQELSPQSLAGLRRDCPVKSTR